MREVNAREVMETGMTEEVTDQTYSLMCLFFNLTHDCHQITNGNATGMMNGLRQRGPGEHLTLIQRY
jgi:hypothetical protein